MPRWYAARYCNGRPDSMAQQVAALVRQHDVGRVLPLIRFERYARGQFLMFLAIESDVPGQLPPELLILRNHPIIRDLMPSASGAGVQTFTLDEIHKMVTGEIGVEDYTRSLFAASLEPPVFAEPFPSDDTDETAIDDFVLLSQRYDQLITWMSAVGVGTLAAAQRACKALGIDEGGQATGRILRRLQLLGHVERSADGGRWSVAPFVLTRVPGPAGEAGYILCGERDQAVLSLLRSAASVTEEPQPQGDAPARVFIVSQDIESVRSRLEEGGSVRGARVDEVASRLAAALPSLEHWQDTLETIPSVKPELYSVRRYHDGEFVEATRVEGTGFYELWSSEPKGPRQQQQPASRLFYDANHGRWLAGDWYGLRYLTLVHQGRSCPAHYDFLSSSLAIPDEWRPPALYERALVLCSGRLPQRRGAWLYYDNVEPAVFTNVAAKLDFAIQENASNA